MKLHFLILLPVILLAGCTSTKQLITPAIVRQGVSALEGYSISKYPDTVPYLKAAAPVICSAANSTNLSPTQVINALEKSKANELKTPQGVLILNSLLVLYIGIWDAYGDDAVNRSPDLQSYLKATCDGMNDRLPVDSRVLQMMLARPWVSFNDWPLVGFDK